VGRLLITFLLCFAGVLREPLLYPSPYLKQNRARYYELLDQVRHAGDWEEWLAFFLEGVRQTAKEAISTAQRVGEIFKADHARIEPSGRRAGSALRVHEALKARAILSMPGGLPRDGALVSGGLLGDGAARGTGDRSRADRKAPQPLVRL
jgi:Fic family protein